MTDPTPDQRRALLLRLAQDWQAGQPVRCRVCRGVWPDHGPGCPVPEALTYLEADRDHLPHQ